MATYYVNASTGNDTTGDGSSGTPWATMAKADATATAGDTIYISGDFVEDDGSGYLVPTKALIWRANGPVTITGTSSTHCIRFNTELTGWEMHGTSTYPIRLQTKSTADTSLFFMNVAATDFVLEHVWFEVPYGIHATFSALNSNATAGRTITNLTMTDCRIIDASKTSLRGVYLWHSAGGTFTRLTIINYDGTTNAPFVIGNPSGDYVFSACEWQAQTGLSIPNGFTAADGTLTLTNNRWQILNTSTGIALSLASGSTPVADVTMTGNVITSAYRGVKINGGVTSVTCTGNVIDSVNMALAVSSDDVAWGDTPVAGGTVSNNVLHSQSGHACLIGRTAASVTVSGNSIVNDTDIALVVKGSDITVQDNPIIRSGGVTPLRLKGCVDAIVRRNRIEGTGASTRTIYTGEDDASHEASGISLTQNTIAATGGGTLFDVEHAADFSDSDNNRYLVSGGSTWGTIEGQAISSLANLRTELAYDLNSQSTSYAAGAEWQSASPAEVVAAINADATQQTLQTNVANIASGATVVRANDADGDAIPTTATIAAALNGQTITITSPYDTTAQTITIVRGDAYLNADSRAITVTIDVGTTMPNDISTATVALKYRRKGSSAAPTSISGTVATAVGQEKVFRFDLTSAQTAVLELGRVYDFEVEVLLEGSSSKPVTPVSGDIIVVTDLSA